MCLHTNACARVQARADFNYPFLTSYERDNETKLDFAQARYYASQQGRFTSADPFMASARTWDPQTWNRYAYVSNRPLSLVDPTGMDGEDYKPNFHVCTVGVDAGCSETRTVLAGVTVTAPSNEQLTTSSFHLSDQYNMTALVISECCQ
jgi:RHS repeat-associated protein